MALHEPALVEVLVALSAMKFCRKMGAHDILLKGDSLLVVKVVSESQPSWLRYGQIIDDIKLVLGSLRKWSIRHVKREANLAAHSLTKCAIRNLDTQVWPEEAPNCILYIVILEHMTPSL
jgi:ribonuclease HI